MNKLTPVLIIKADDRVNVSQTVAKVLTILNAEVSERLLYRSDCTVSEAHFDTVAPIIGQW